jgi:hypothetical protein
MNWLTIQLSCSYPFIVKWLAYSFGECLPRTHPRRVFEAMVQTQHSPRNLIEDIEIANGKILPHTSPTLLEVFMCVCASTLSPSVRLEGDVDLFGRFLSSRARSDVALGVFYPFRR